MRFPRAIAVMLIGLAGAAWAESYRFDMGDETTPLTPGYTLVTPKTLIDANAEFGWTDIAPQPSAHWPCTVYRNDPLSPCYADEKSLAATLYTDSMCVLGGATFVFKVKPGRYAVTATMGDLMPGEGRDGMAIAVNGVAVVKDESTDGQVKSFTFPADAPEGRISLRFSADYRTGNYVMVEAVTAESLADGQECRPGVAVYPTVKPVAADYRRNFEHCQAGYVAKWERIKTQLRAEEPGFDFWQAREAELRKDPAFRPFYAIATVLSWDRYDEYAQGIDLGGICRALKEMGIDGVTDNSRTSLREYPRCGFQYIRIGHGEKGFWGMDATRYAANRVKDEKGHLTTVPGNWCPLDPALLKDFRKFTRGTLAPILPGAAFMVIDEPRGAWYASGRYGDFSEPAQTAFRLWAREKGYDALAQAGIPDRARSMDFYRFYQFRLETPVRFSQEVTADLPRDVPIYVGQGDAGPQALNHSSFWPPSFGPKGLHVATWAYNDAASSKMFAEAVRIGEEYGARSCLFPPLVVYKHTPASALASATAGLSAMNPVIITYESRSDTIDKPEWVKAMYYQARLTHAMTGLKHTPSLYVWWPESLVYNDLVALRSDEAAVWMRLWQALFDANVDYAVTNRLAIPKDATLVYACARPVLNREEFDRLAAFVRNGGTLCVTFDDAPEFPDGTIIGAWAELPRERIVRAALSADAFRTAAAGVKVRNAAVASNVVKTYRYQRGGKVVHLLNNTDDKAPAAARLPMAVVDVCRNAHYRADAEIVLPPGQYLLAEEQ